MPQVVKQSPRGQPKKPTGGILSRLPSAWDMTETFSLLLYGRSGTGKTTLWATFPKPILAIVCSGGMKPGELGSINTPELKKVIVPKVVRQSTDVRELIAVAEDFATVVLDHGSGFQDLVLKEILGLEELPAQKSWGMASQQQYGQCTLQCKEIFRAFLSLPCYRVIVAQERTFGEDAAAGEGIVPVVGAALTPSLTGWLNPACDHVVETFIRGKTVEKTVKIAGKETRQVTKVKGVEFCLRTAPDPVYITKFRLPKGRDLPDVIVDPSFTKIRALIDGEEVEE